MHCDDTASGDCLAWVAPTLAVGARVCLGNGVRGCDLRADKSGGGDDLSGDMTHGAVCHRRRAGGDGVGLGGGVSRGRDLSGCGWALSDSAAVVNEGEATRCGAIGGGGTSRDGCATSRGGVAPEPSGRGR